ncbi:neuronal acetylcholine receptor subunit alpha-7-like [Antennarius striatus]|uniref:neuronal acetylcholine receptor subunit alpha-7-like n=1 Tax=Antennarius striatus TaxID=241820 RepID=UPI0035B4D7E8
MDVQDLLFFLAVTASTMEVSLQGPDQHRLYVDLMSRYNPLVRPISNDSHTLTVNFGLSLMQIMDVDEKNQVLTTNIWLRMYWYDNYLQWDPSQYGDVNAVRLPYDLIWKPDILLYNSADERFDASFHTNILVNSSGTCSYLPPGIFKSICYIDVRWFPFDVQRCELKFGSWTHGGFSLDLKMMEADITSYTPNGEWDLVEIPGRINQRSYDCCKETYPDITYTIVMRRRTVFYGLNLLLPCILISTLALLVFLLPADSGEKISLGITVLLSLTVFMLLVAEIMPATSDSVPLIAQYFATTMVIVGFSVIATVLVLRYHHHDPDGSKMPKWTRVILLEWCAWLLRMRRPGEDRVRSASHNKAQQSSPTSMELSPGAPASQSTNGMQWLESLHYSTTAASPDSGGRYGQPVGRTSEDEVLLPTSHSCSVGSIESELAKILDEIRHIGKHFPDQDKDKSVCNEWKFAASVIDRLCLVVFSLFTIFCTIGILMSAPNFVEAISKDFFN